MCPISLNIYLYIFMANLLYNSNVRPSICKKRYVVYAGLAILTINSTKNHQTFGSMVGVYQVFFM